MDSEEIVKWIVVVFLIFVLFAVIKLGFDKAKDVSKKENIYYCKETGYTLKKSSELIDRKVNSGQLDSVMIFYNYSSTCFKWSDFKLNNKTKKKLCDWKMSGKNKIDDKNCDKLSKYCGFC